MLQVDWKDTSCLPMVVKFTIGQVNLKLKENMEFGDQSDANPSLSVLASLLSVSEIGVRRHATLQRGGGAPPRRRGQYSVHISTEFRKRNSR